MDSLESYFDDLKIGVDEEYRIANEARKKGFDPEKKVEVDIALTLAEKCVSLIRTIYPKLPVKKISDRILKLEDEYGQLDATVSFVIAREIAEEKFLKFSDKLEAIDCGIRVGFSYMTLGVVASPLEGYTGLELGKTKENKDYFIVNFSGPIRSAGTTATCVILMLIDYLREYFGYSRYDPDEDEVNRYIQENTDYHERVTNLQYFPTEEEMRFLAKNLPIQISGDPTEKKEVSNYKDLKRVKTNFIRGGMCLTFSEGLAQKAGKALGRLNRAKENGIKSTGWDFLEKYEEIHKKRSSGFGDVEATYIKDLVAGRPVYGHPGMSGGFRLRYGRGRTAGFSAVSVHPATMGVTNGFLSNGTQLKIERPTKGCIITSCDTIDGPIVKLKNGSVKKLEDFEESKKLYFEIEEVIYLGDMLFPVGDIIDRNADLLPVGFVEEWWELLAKEDSAGIDLERAIKISKEKQIPLYPGFIFYWTQINLHDLVQLSIWLKAATWRSNKLVFPWENSVREKYSRAKRAMEILGVEHDVHMDNILVDEIVARALLYNLGFFEIYNGQNFEFKVDETDNRSVLEIINDRCEVQIKDKAGTFIGSRMGRPEKAKLRSLTGSPNVLFPVGDQGGRFRSVQAAVETGFVKSEFPVYFCEKCNLETVCRVCENCGSETKERYYCRDCGEVKEDMCKLHKNCNTFYNRKVKIDKIFDSAVSTLGLEQHEIPPLIKGVRRLDSGFKIPENLMKGVLRAKHNLSVNKDGTIRYDGTEIPITHFKPVEIRVGVDKLKELGYEKDINGEDLKEENQILELLPHDIILPSCSETQDEKADDVFVNIGNFLDEELEKIYGMKRLYNLMGRDGLIGQKVVCMSPHNCAGVVGRIIGWTQMQGIMASPYMHAAMRRDCDGDECAVMMLMDVLLNFSRKFLPSHRGGTQDAPLVLNSRIRAGEVDDQILSFETASKYPLELYQMAEMKEHSSQIKIDLVRDKLKEGIEPFVGAGFTHNTSDINLGFVNGAYKKIPTMKEKVDAQMELVSKIRAVDTDDVARLILERHFIRDIVGNLRKFARQQFRCSNCNEKYRRIPIKGECLKCGGKIIFTISEGSVKKYMEPALELSLKYNISSYTREVMDLTNDYIESIFGKGEKNSNLDSFEN